MKEKTRIGFFGDLQPIAFITIFRRKKASLSLESLEKRVLPSAVGFSAQNYYPGKHSTHYKWR